MRFSGRTVLITGGSSGIGLEFANQLAARGNTVIITGRDQAALDQATRASTLTGIVSDVSDPAAIASLFGAVTTRFPTLDTIINNAGIMRNLRLAEPRALTDLSTEIEINLNGPIWMIQQFLPHLQASGDGLIVNVSSGLAFVPLPAAPIYCATKAALHAYTRSLRVQLQGSAVRVVEVAPPGTETPLMRREFAAEMEGQKGMDPVKMVTTAIKAIEAGRTEIAPGLATVLKIASRVAPGPMFKMMARMSAPRPA